MDQPTQNHPASEDKSRSLSSIIGCGCAIVVALFLVAIVATTLLTYRAGKQMKEVAGDPQRAAAAVREVLPYEELPDGYHPVGVLSVPWVMDIAFLGGPAEPTEGESLSQGFVFVRIRDWFGRGERSRQVLESGEGDDAPIAQQQIRFEPEETLGRGEIASGGATVAWVARRGKVEMNVSDVIGEAEDGEPDRLLGQDRSRDGTRERGAEDVPAGAGQGPQRGILTVLSIDCGEKGWQRMGIWFEQDPAPDTPAGQADLAGTPADPEAIGRHLGHFRLCGRSRSSG